MARPQATILAEFVNKKTKKAVQILASDAIWAVFYMGKPFNLKEISLPYTSKNVYYLRNAFSSKAPAANLAKKFNKLFNCCEFSVVKLMSGDSV